MQNIRRLFPLITIVVTIIGLIACGSSSSNTGTNAGTATTTVSGNTPTPAAQHFKVGQTVKVGDTWDITVNSAKTSTGSEFYKPQKPGDVFLVFQVAAKNISSQEQNISSALQFTLLDTTGQKYDITIDPNAGATLDGKVEAGQTLKGAVAYEIPKATHHFNFEFQADITSPGQTIWDIHV